VFGNYKINKIFDLVCKTSVNNLMIK